MTTANSSDILDRSEAGGPKSSVALWAGVVGIPLIWLVQLQTSYALVIWVGPTQKYWVMHLVSVLFLVLTGVGGVLSWREWREAGGGSPDTTEGGIAARNRLMG